VASRRRPYRLGPLAPSDSGFAIGFVEYHEPAILEAWVFVPEQHFVAVDVEHYVAPVTETNVILTESATRSTFAPWRGGVQ
jgi:hypothetical protein